MTEKELKKLNRYQLLELLIMQTERADQLQKELKEVRQELDAQQIRISNLGSIAEASLQLSGVFEAAQKAAELYLTHAREEADRILREAEKKACVLESPVEEPEAAEESAAEE